MVIRDIIPLTFHSARAFFNNPFLFETTPRLVCDLAKNYFPRDTTPLRVE